METEKNETVAIPGQEYHITDRRGEDVVGKELVLHSSVSTDAITRIFNQTPATKKEFANDQWHLRHQFNMTFFASTKLPLNEVFGVLKEP